MLNRNEWEKKHIRNFACVCFSVIRHEIKISGQVKNVILC